MQTEWNSLAFKNKLSRNPYFNSNSKFITYRFLQNILATSRFTPTKMQNLHHSRNFRFILYLLVIAMLVSSVYVGRTLIEQGREWFLSRNQINPNQIPSNTTVVATISGTSADRRPSAPGGNLNNLAFNPEVVNKNYLFFTVIVFLLTFLIFPIMAVGVFNQSLGLKLYSLDFSRLLFLIFVLTSFYVKNSALRKFFIEYFFQ